MIIKAIKNWFTLRDERSREKAITAVELDAKRRIYLSDNNAGMCIMFDDFPAIVLSDNITVMEALEQLAKVRDQYITSHV